MCDGLDETEENEKLCARLLREFLLLKDETRDVREGSKRKELDRGKLYPCMQEMGPEKKIQIKK